MPITAGFDYTSTSTVSENTGDNDQLAIGTGTAYVGGSNSSAINVSGGNFSGSNGADITYNITEESPAALAAATAFVDDAYGQERDQSQIAKLALLSAFGAAQDAQEQASELSKQETKTPIQQLTPIIGIVVVGIALTFLFTR